ncbi:MULTISPECIES: GNAT family N-acetyltransferase [Methylomonas]|uniref:GCN5 family acetyltransferase n=2 Tax=Methylomonas TaxID=416 RepID=A0A126T457_9GAMM|nr:MULTISPECIES: GNAT family N-acetyltransferase [Methylomonas]AMK76840.1 GCN5 family acetyltransferase [Methylomonas denitrificans]OAI03396.1 GCN5 family acetyltransferase [Methylomonas methanica]TCV76958.1 ribosomal protein S18 acetylase RimI-like enzyme [Methylomonas methanica]
MEINLASETDIPALCQLLSELFGQEAEFQPDYATQSQGLRLIIADPAIGHILVARTENRIVGMVNLLYTVSTALGGRVAWLEDMTVLSGARGNGVGSLLLERAVEFARQNGCHRLTLLTDADNLQAQRFYQRQGFKASGMLPMRLIF